MKKSQQYWTYLVSDVLQKIRIWFPFTHSIRQYKENIGKLCFGNSYSSFSCKIWKHFFEALVTKNRKHKNCQTSFKKSAIHCLEVLFIYYIEQSLFAKWEKRRTINTSIYIIFEDIKMNLEERNGSRQLWFIPLKVLFFFARSAFFVFFYSLTKLEVFKLFSEQIRNFFMSFFATVAPSPASAQLLL